MKRKEKKVNWSLEHLRIFSYLSETKSLSSAARRAGLTQPAVTMKLQQLEEMLNTKLWRRRGRWEGYLTDAGVIFRDYTEKILRETESLMANAIFRGISREIVIGASTIPGEHILPELTAKFREQYPDVHVRVRITDSAGVQNMIHRREVVIGFCGEQPDPEVFHSRPCGADRIVLIAPENSDLAKKKRIDDLVELGGVMVIWREQGSGTRRRIEEMMKQNSLQFPRNIRFMEVGSSQSVYEAVRLGLGVGFISEYAAGHLPRVEIRGLTPITRSFYLFWEKNMMLDDIHREFLEFVDSFYCILNE